VKYTFVIAFVMSNLFVVHPASAQFHIPVPGIGGKKAKNQPSSQPSDPSQPPSAPPDNSDRGRGKAAAEPPGPKPAGVPVPLDSPVFQSFQKLDQQKVYHQRMILTANDPKMQQMMEQMGFKPAETITSGDVKQVVMQYKMPFDGKSEDFVLRSVSVDGRIASRWESPAKDRILASQDAQIDKQLAESEAQSGTSIAKDLAMGPAGIASAALQGGAAAANAAEAASARKTAHDFWEWQCKDGGPKKSDIAKAKTQPPPMTDLRVVGDDNISGVAVTTYEFYIQQNGRFSGPMQLSVAKDSGLPVRMGMNDPRMQGSMEMDYFGFNDDSAFEVPGCLAGK
jgi:hypothetical protein